MLVSMTEFKINIFITTGASSLHSFLMIIKQQVQIIKKVAAFPAHLGPVYTWSLRLFSLIV